MGNLTEIEIAKFKQILYFNLDQLFNKIQKLDEVSELNSTGRISEKKNEKK